MLLFYLDVVVLFHLHGLADTQAAEADRLVSALAPCRPPQLPPLRYHWDFALWARRPRGLTFGHQSLELTSQCG